MIEAKEFVEIARNKGFTRYAGVPCSFLTPFINYVINDDNLTYISSANEGDALATICGLTIGGKKGIVMMQNSGLGNAINPLTSLAYTFRIPFILITTLRGDPHLKDEPQHELMGQITEKMLDLMAIPWEYFPTEAKDIPAVLERIETYFQEESRPYALVMRKGTVAPVTLQRESIPNPQFTPQNLQSVFQVKNDLHSRQEALQRVISLTDEKNTVVIGTTGFTGRELFALSDRPNHLYMVGSMGCASSLGLGLSLAREDLKIVVIDGDGAGLMRMGNFATLGTYGKGNLIHLLLDNSVHDSTGAQATVSSRVSFAKIALSCGYEIGMEGNSLDLINNLFSIKSEGVKFGHLKIISGTNKNLPRPNLSPFQGLQRLINHISLK
jgi:phosphonopyruvate decarboxylase